MSSTDLNRDRPYDGQLHTFVGRRGSFRLETPQYDPYRVVPTKSITIRDVYDSVLIGLARAAGIPEDVIRAEGFDVYSVDLSQVDPVAAAQNACVSVEEMLGIYPNLPKDLTPEELG